MANHCDSDMKITGAAEWVGEFLGRHVIEEDGTILSLDSIRPYPAEYKELDRIANEYMEQHLGDWRHKPKDGFNQGGYEWRIANWGTKWGCYQGTSGQFPIERIPEGVILHFATAWSPISTELLQEVSARFPHLRFEYDAYDCGMGFHARLVLEAGRVLEQGSYEYAGERGG